jgi:hypothetical protein
LLMSGFMPLAAQLGPEIKICVISSATGRGLADARVVVTADAGGVGREYLTDTRGELSLSPTLIGSDRLREVVFEVAAEDHVGSRRQRYLDQNGATLYFELAALSQASQTPLLSAGHAYALNLPGLGRLEVAAGALAADARLELLALTPEQVGQLDAEVDLCGAVHLEVKDAAGRPAAHLLSAAPDAIRLTAEPWFKLRLPRDARGGEIQHLEIDGRYRIIEKRRLGGHRFDRFTTLLLPGLNLFHFDYLSVDGACRRWGPWALHMLPIGSSGDGRVSIPISCGFLGGTGQVGVEAGDEVTNTLGISAEASAQVGWEAGALFGRVSAQVGLKVTGNFANSTTHTRLIESSVGTPPSGTANGAPAGQLTPPWSCMDGNFVLGFVDKRFACYARRLCLDPGSGGWNLKYLGEVEVSQGLESWLENLRWNASCPGCTPTGQLPTVPHPNTETVPDVTSLVPR